jgi:hypothetical protein
MNNPFDWDYLTTPPASNDVFDAFTIVYLALFLVGFVVSVYLNYRPWTKPIGSMVRRTAVIKATGIAMWVFGIGLFFFIIRLLQINPLSFGEPIWMWLSLVTAIAMCIWIAVYWSNSRKPAGVPASSRVSGSRHGAPTSQPVRRPVRRKTTLR